MFTDVEGILSDRGGCHETDNQGMPERESLAIVDRNGMRDLSVLMSVAIPSCYQTPQRCGSFASAHGCCGRASPFASLHVIMRHVIQAIGPHLRRVWELFVVRIGKLAGKKRRGPELLCICQQVLAAVILIGAVGVGSSRAAQPAQADANPKSSPAARYDVLLRGGLIFDGSGSDPITGDIAIQGDRIAAIGELADATAATEIPLDGQAVAPGFINVLSWATESLLADGKSQSDIRQGVTLEIFGEGWSMGPLNEPDEEGLARDAGRHQVRDRLDDAG